MAAATMAEKERKKTKKLLILIDESQPTQTVAVPDNLGTCEKRIKAIASLLWLKPNSGVPIHRANRQEQLKHEIIYKSHRVYSVYKFKVSMIMAACECASVCVCVSVFIFQ